MINFSVKNMAYYFLALFVLLVNECAAYTYDLSACMIFRDEAPYLKEWIEFHRLVGVQHFYLYSHNSADNYREVLEPYVQSGLVELVEYQDDEDSVRTFYHYQSRAYNDGLAKNRGISKWMVCLDSDEFLFPVQMNSLVEFLKEYEDCVGIAANWQMYGTSHIPFLKEGQCMTQCLVRKAPLHFEPNHHIKSIVRPEYISHYWNPHFPVYIQGCQVNTDKQPFLSQRTPCVLIDKLRINHYWTRDEHYWNHYKIPRRLQRGEAFSTLQWYHTELNREVDTAIYRYLPALKKAMQRVSPP